MPHRDLRALPKANLHIHLEGALRPSTLDELCERYGMERPTDTRGRQFDNFGGFNRLYHAACDCIRSHDDLARLLLERAGLPTRPPDRPRRAYLSAMAVDKKKQGEEIHFHTFSPGTVRRLLECVCAAVDPSLELLAGGVLPAVDALTPGS